jgi:uncharacterized membrane protein
MRTDEKIQTAILVVLAAYGVLVAAPVVLGDRVVEPFSELGLLGPEMKLGDYPRELLVGEGFDLFLYLGNHMGELSYYRVYAKLGDSGLNVSDSVPYGGRVVEEYEYVLVDEANVTLPISMSLGEAGLNRRLVFELHRFEGDSFVYDGIWIQLWLNVTSPP